MKIFNIQPIKVTEYISNREYLAESHANFSYESGFSFTGKMVESLKTMIITFNILYTVGGEDKSYIIPSSNNPDQYKIHVECEEGNDIFLSYKSSCQFNFENEDFDTDLLTITEFLGKYHIHTETFLKQHDLLKRVQEMEEKARKNNSLNANALLAIDCLRANGMYYF